MDLYLSVFRIRFIILYRYCVVMKGNSGTHTWALKEIVAAVLKNNYIEYLRQYERFPLCVTGFFLFDY